MNRTILIVDDVATNRIVFKVKLGAAGYAPLVAEGGADCLRIAHESKPDLILLDLMLEDMPGIEVLRRLRADPLTQDIPVIVISASRGLGDRLAAFNAGADDFFVKPFDDDLLLSRVRNLIRSQQDIKEMTRGSDDLFMGMAEPAAEFATPGLIAFVSDHPAAADRMRRELAPLMRDRMVTMDYANALGDGQTTQPSSDIYILDTGPKEAQRSLRMISNLRSRVSTGHAGVCLMIKEKMQDDAQIAFDLGANEVVDAEMPMKELALRLRAILRRKRRGDSTRERLQNGLRLAMVDPLTSLFNRRYGLARLGNMAENAAASGRPLAVMIADIDRFKSVNDKFGHSSGDEVLIDVAHSLLNNLRGNDLLARIGGEEFLIALPDTGLETAQKIAKRLCGKIESRLMELPNGASIKVTISIGLAVIDPAEDQNAKKTANRAMTLVERADQALLTSKAGGRNMVSIAYSAA